MKRLEGEKKKRVYRKNTVPGRQRGKKYPEAVKTAALCELLGNSNLSDVAKKYGVPESTLRGWMTKAAQEGPEGEKSLWVRAREEEIRQITLKAAQGARLNLELILRRLEAGERNLRRCDEIDRLLLGADKTEGMVTTENGVVIGEVREQMTISPAYARQLVEERARRGDIIPSDFVLSNYLRTLTAVSARGAAERENESGEAIEVRMDADTEALAR